MSSTRKTPQQILQDMKGFTPPQLNALREAIQGQVVTVIGLLHAEITKLENIAAQALASGEYHSTATNKASQLSDLARDLQEFKTKPLIQFAILKSQHQAWTEAKSGIVEMSGKTATESFAKSLGTLIQMEAAAENKILNDAKQKSSQAAQPTAAASVTTNAASSAATAEAASAATTTVSQTLTKEEFKNEEDNFTVRRRH